MDNLTEEQSLKKEIEFIKLYRGLGYCEANLTDGGEGTCGHKISEEQLKKLSERNSGKNNPMYGKKAHDHPAFGKKRTIESKIKLSKALKGIPKTEQAKKKMSEAKHGKYDGDKNPMFGKKGLLAPAFGKKGSKCQNSKKVIDICTGFIWDSAVEAADVYGIHPGTMVNKLNGYNKNNTNLRYLEDVE